MRPLSQQKIKERALARNRWYIEIFARIFRTAIMVVSQVLKRQPSFCTIGKTNTASWIPVLWAALATLVVTMRTLALITSSTRNSVSGASCTARTASSAVGTTSNTVKSWRLRGRGKEHTRAKLAQIYRISSLYTTLRH